jgi:hypothetical protein
VGRFLAGQLGIRVLLSFFRSVKVMMRSREKGDKICINGESLSTLMRVRLQRSSKITNEASYHGVPAECYKR